MRLSEGSPVMLAYDNLFDKTGIESDGASESFTHGTNGYVGIAHLSGTSSGGDKDITWPADYLAGPLGNYYYPTTGGNLSPLIDAGSRTAVAAGLAQYTTRTDQTPDSGDVDIGFHYKAPPPCDNPTIEGWVFTDEGFIAGGQIGVVKRAYTDPSDVPASPWSFLSPDKRSFKIAFEDDGVTCSGANQLRQVATVEVVVTVGCSTLLTVSWDGIVEWQNGGYDKMYLYVDDVQSGYAESREEGRGCDYMGPPLSDPEPPIQVSLDSGTHLLRIRADTRDAQYHTGAYYEFQLSLQPE